MKGCNTWGFKPYIPADHSLSGPYICRIAPGVTSVQVEWRHADDVACEVFYAPRATEEWRSQKAEGRQITIENLQENQDYELYLQSADGKKSRTRLFRTGFIPGTVVSYLHPEDLQYSVSGRYLCSPSIARLPGGAMVVSMDVFEHKGPQNLSLLYRSDDGGQSWRFVTELFPCFWGRLFWHRGALYMLGASTEYGDLLIGRSEDEGSTWTMPTVLFRGSGNIQECGNHRAPTVILQSRGRLWTGAEYGCWNKQFFAAGVLSVDEAADLLQAENWSCTGYRPVDPAWPGALADSAGGIEGNVVEAPDGRIVNILRYGEGKALMLEVDWRRPEKPLTFCKVLNFPLGHTKFEIQRRRDGVYYAAGNPAPARNVLSIYRSKDLETWEHCRDIVQYRAEDPQKVGFQYPSFLWEDSGMALVSRTAYNQAHNFHDSNCITFHRVFL